MLAHAWLQSWVLVSHSLISTQSAHIRIHLKSSSKSGLFRFISGSNFWRWIPSSKSYISLGIFIFPIILEAFFTATLITSIGINTSGISATSLKIIDVRRYLSARKNSYLASKTVPVSFHITLVYIFTVESKSSTNICITIKTLTLVASYWILTISIFRTYIWTWAIPIIQSMLAFYRVDFIDD